MELLYTARARQAAQMCMHVRPSVAAMTAAQQSVLQHTRGACRVHV